MNRDDARVLGKHQARPERPRLTERVSVSMVERTEKEGTTELLPGSADMLLRG